MYRSHVRRDRKRCAYRKAGTIEILQSVLDAFSNAPLLFLVPLLLLAFIIWAPWSPKNFYLHQHDFEHLEADAAPTVDDRGPQAQ